MTFLSPDFLCAKTLQHASGAILLWCNRWFLPARRLDRGMSYSYRRLHIVWFCRCSARPRQPVMRQHRGFGIVIAVARILIWHIWPLAALRKFTITQTPVVVRPHFQLPPERRIYETESSSTAHSVQIYKPAETRLRPYSQKRWILPDAHGYRPDKYARCKIGLNGYPLAESLKRL